MKWVIKSSITAVWGGLVIFLMLSQQEELMVAITVSTVVLMLYLEYRGDI